MADPYTFVKVEDFFSSSTNWSTLNKVVSHQYDPDTYTLTLNLQKSSDPNDTCAMQLLFLQQNLFRVRINPGKLSADDFARRNTRTIVQDTTDDLRRILEERLPFKVDYIADAGPSGGNKIILTTSAMSAVADSGSSTSAETRPIITVEIDRYPLRISVYDARPRNFSERQFPRPLLWQTAGIKYKSLGNDDFSVIQALEKPGSMRYVGFGEHGGTSLYKNAAQLVYFNYDNMTYSQVYNQGGLDNREPLYHADPFFCGFDSTAGRDSVYGIFVDNAGQVCLDVGKQSADKLLLGTRFNDMDYYFVLGDDPAQVLTDYTALVGRPRLKPRYALGYHQGAFGYTSGGKWTEVVDRYRKLKIPLDAIHMDVDIQKDYKVFTVDEAKFPNPKGMFDKFREKGIKCCTNITTIISNENQTPSYEPYNQGIAGKDGKPYFVADVRFEPNSNASKSAQWYGGGNLNTVPFDKWDSDSKRLFNSGNPYLGRVWYGREETTRGHYPDFGRREVRLWWGTLYQKLFDLGLEFVWQDMTTPAIPVYHEGDTEGRPPVPYGDMKGFPYRLKVTDDFLSGASKEELKTTPAVKVWNLYSYNLHKATYHGLNHLKGRENKRNFIIGRGCYSGMHRFAALWTGDNKSDWDFLKINVAQVLSLGMCGLALVGQDIGGFETIYPGGRKEEWANPMLLIRWTIAGAFLPWFRNHYNHNTKLFQEPFMYEDYFTQNNRALPDKDLYTKVVPICRHYISLRYRLMQLFYDLMFQNMLDGMPICRPLFINDHKDNALYTGPQLERLNDEFFIGRDMLVAPVLEREEVTQGKRDVYLPAGSRWYCFEANYQDKVLPLAAAVQGGVLIKGFDAGIAGMNWDSNRISFLCPIYVREGGVIPTILLEQYVGELNALNKPNPITYNIYPGLSGSYTTYLDDGVSRSSAPADAPQFKYGDEAGIAKSEYRKTRLDHSFPTDDARFRLITVERLHDGYTPKFEDHFYVALLHDWKEESSSGASGPLNGVAVGGAAAVEVRDRISLEAASKAAWWYDSRARISYIKVPDDKGLIEIQANYDRPVPWAKA